MILLVVFLASLPGFSLLPFRSVRVVGLLQCDRSPIAALAIAIAVAFALLQWQSNEQEIEGFIKIFGTSYIQKLKAVHFFVAEEREREREDVRSFGTIVCFRTEIHPHHPPSMSFSMRFSAAHFLTVTAMEKLEIVVIRADDDEAAEAAAVLNSESGGCVRARNCGLPPHYKHAR
jgi:hypothetical protein